MRAGTENVPAAVALESALSLCLPDEQTRLASLRDEFEWRMVSEGLGVRVNAASAQRLANTSNLYFPGISGEALLIALDMQGMCVSTGSACSSGSIEASPVLLAMGLTPKEARSCIRFSFGRGNTRADIAELVSAISVYARKMRGKQLV
jgi:cysteine desulfurase